MEEILESVRVATGFVKKRYRSAARAAGISNYEFQDWAESMAGLGVATAWNSLDDYDSSRGRFVTYIIYKTKSVVRGSLREHFRFIKAQRAAAEAFDLEPEPSQTEPYITREEALEILRALTEEQQQAVTLTYQGYSTDEITTIMEKKSKYTVYSILRRARQKSQETYEEMQKELDGLSEMKKQPGPRGKPKSQPDEPDDYSKASPQL